MFDYLILSLSLISVSALLLLLFRIRLPRAVILLTLLFVLFIAMLIFDTYLTALPIVMYNSKSVLPFRLGSIPIEDFSYLIAVIILVPALFDKFHHDKKD